MSVFSFLEGKLDFIGWETFLGVAVGAVAVAFLLAFWIGKEFFASASALHSAVFLAVTVIKSGVTDLDRAVLFLAFAAVESALYIALCAAEKIRETKSFHKDKKKSKTIERDLYYALPDRENAFLKERLLTGLSANNADEDRFVAETKAVKLGFVYRMIAKLKKAPLSAADRLETENLSELLKKYAEKETLTASELRGFNDSMSAVLKLSAKYAL